jgi:hypothetical protein
MEFEDALSSSGVIGNNFGGSVSIVNLDIKLNLKIYAQPLNLFYAFCGSFYNWG